MNKFICFLIIFGWSLASSGADLTTLDAARALFKQRCATAGERISRVVKNVDGVLLMKLRPSTINGGEQFRLDDPYGMDYRGEGYIESFLQAHHELPIEIARLRGYAPTPRTQIGYAFVEAKNPKDGQRHRYTAILEQPGKTNPNYIMDYVRVIVTSRPSTGKAPRYGVTYEDISTPEDRKFWIAGSSLKVIDTLTEEVIGERIGYMLDLGQGNKSGGRSPWLIAAHHACPGFDGVNPGVPQGGQTDVFVEKVLHPRIKPKLSSDY